MNRRLSRAHALLASALLLFGSFRGVLGPTTCAQHDRPAATGTHAGHTAPAHGGHAAHQASTGQTSAPDDHVPCTCLDHCSACQLFTLPAYATPVALASVVLTSRIAAPTVHVPARVSHQLPFANAPPAIA